MFNDPAFSALAIIGVVGLVVGLVGGVVAGAKQLVGTMLMGVVGAIALAAVARAAGAPPVYSAGQNFSYLYGAVGGLILSYVVGRSDRR